MAREIPQSTQEQIIWGQQSANALGLHAMWGFSPAFDLLAALPRSVTDAPPPADGAAPEPINVLLVQPADIRHILFTVARRRRGDTRKMQRPIHFYVFEPVLEVRDPRLSCARVA